MILGCAKRIRGPKGPCGKHFLLVRGCDPVKGDEIGSLLCSAASSHYRDLGRKHLSIRQEEALEYLPRSESEDS